MAGDAWAFGWTAVAAIATSAAVIVAASAWRVEASRSKKARATLVFVRSANFFAPRDEIIAETRLDEFGQRWQHGVDGNRLSWQSAATVVNDEGALVGVDISRETSVHNTSPVTIYEVIGTPLISDSEEIMDRTKGRTIFVSSMAPGSSAVFSSDVYNWVGGTGVRLEFRMEGAVWFVDSEGGFGKVRFVRARSLFWSVRNRIRRSKRTRRIWDD